MVERIVFVMYHHSTAKRDRSETLRLPSRGRAIKLVRFERNIGLKDSKDAVEEYLLRQPALQHPLQTAQAQGREGFFRRLVVGLLLAAAGAYRFFRK